MDNVLAVLGLFGPASLIIALVVMAQLSQRLGAVTKRTPLYRWFYISVALVALSIVARLSSIPGTASDTIMIISDLSLVIGLGTAVVVAWRYWGWLLNEREKDIRSR